MAVTVTGPAGIGKSRLVRELLDDIGDDATIAIGRCLSYGEDVAYRPLAEIVRQVGGEQPAAGIAALLDGDEALTRSVLRAVGLGDDAPVQADETFWAVRRLLERAPPGARSCSRSTTSTGPSRRSWTSSTTSDAFSGAHPILVLCLGRPEFVEMRPGWFAPGSGRTVIALEPLGQDEALELCATCPAPPGSCGAPRATRCSSSSSSRWDPTRAHCRRASRRSSPPASSASTPTSATSSSAPRSRACASTSAARTPRATSRRSRARASSAPIARVRTPSASSTRSSATRRTSGVPKERRAGLHEEAAAVAVQRRDRGSPPRGGLPPAPRAGARRPARARELAAGASARLEAAGEAALRRGDAPAGARLLERAAALAPGSPELLPRLGAALLEAGRLVDADDAMTRAIEDPAADDA